MTGSSKGYESTTARYFKLEEHMTRLFDSAKAIRMTKIPLTKAELTEAVIRTVRLNNFRDAHIRPIITRGCGKPGTDPNRAVRSSVLVLANPFPPILGDKPARLITSSVRRKSPHSVDPRIKSLNYLDNVLAKIQANVAGADDAILLDINSFVAEATGENIFFVRGHRGTHLTPLLH